MSVSKDIHLTEDEKKAIYQKITQQLETVYDPEIPVDVWNLGLIYRIEIHENGVVEIDMTLTAPGCPVAGELQQEVKDKIEAISGVSQAIVNLVWRPIWSPSMITDKGRDVLAALGVFF